LVAGPSGCGKTTWIHKQLSESASAIYVGLGSELLIDERYLSISFPSLRGMPEPLVEFPILYEQIARMIVFSDGCLMFEAPAETHLEIHTGTVVSAIVANRTPCDRLAI
jgi:GTPase SAR1 family protein